MWWLPWQFFTSKLCNSSMQHFSKMAWKTFSFSSVRRDDSKVLFISIFHRPNYIRCWNESAFYITCWKSDHHSSWGWWCSIKAFPGNVELWDTALLKFIPPFQYLWSRSPLMCNKWMNILCIKLTGETSSASSVHCRRRIRSLQFEFKFAMCLHSEVS